MGWRGMGPRQGIKIKKRIRLGGGGDQGGGGVNGGVVEVDFFNGADGHMVARLHSCIG